MTFWAVSLRHRLVQRARCSSHLLLLMAFLQLGLGISTLLLHVPVPLASAHQGGAVLLLTAAILLNHALRDPLPASAAAAPGTAGEPSPAQ